MKFIFRLLIFMPFFAINPLDGNTFSQSPQEKAKALILKASEVTDPSISLIYLNDAYQYIYALEDSLEASLYLNLGVAHTNLSHMDSAQYFLNQALNIASKNSDLLLEISTLKKLGDVAKLENKYEQASNYYSLALEKSNHRKLNLSKIKKASNSKSDMLNGGALSVSLLFISLLLYLNIKQRKKYTQKEKYWVQKFNKLTASSEAIESKKFSVSIKVINQHLINPLSQREYEVLCLIVTNNTNTLIAEQLFVSVNTVKTHLKNIFEKLDVTNRKEAIEKVINIKSEGLK